MGNAILSVCEVTMKTKTKSKKQKNTFKCMNCQQNAKVELVNFVHCSMRNMEVALCGECAYTEKSDQIECMMLELLEDLKKTDSLDYRQKSKVAVIFSLIEFRNSSM